MEFSDHLTILLPFFVPFLSIITFFLLVSHYLGTGTGEGDANP